MFHLGVPTSRALSLVVSDQTKVVRDPLYSGNQINEKCAVVLRVAPTFMRFGSFEIFLKRDPQTQRQGPSYGLEAEMMPAMLDYVIDNFYPEITQKNPVLRVNEFLDILTKRTAELAAHWQTVGFCHGVLNTDNMSLVGLTIDYGPFGFMDHYDPKHICNHSDDSGRYRYEAQPEICLWNLQKLRSAIASFVDCPAGTLEQTYWATYNTAYQSLMAKKLGLHQPDPSLV